MQYTPSMRARRQTCACVQAWQTRHQAQAKREDAPLAGDERLLVLVLRNLADLLAEPLCTAAAPAEAAAVELCCALYADALQLDASDAIVWLRLASVAVAGGSQAVARSALEQGLRHHAAHPLLRIALLELLLQVRSSFAAHVACDVHRCARQSRYERGAGAAAGRRARRRRNGSAPPHGRPRQQARGSCSCHMRGAAS